MKKQIGIIGTGSIANAHVQAYRAISDQAQVVACCDLDDEKALAFARKYDIPRVYADYNDMMEKEALDCVSVCTWNSAHAAASIAALRGGAHVLCEKPMAMNAREALEMERAAKENDRLLQVGFVRRFGRDADAVQNLARNGVLGDVYYAKASYLRRSGGPGGWFCDVSYAGGGPLIDLGVHMIDLAKYLAGNPKPVSVFGACYAGMDAGRALDGKAEWDVSPSASVYKRDVEDLAVAMIRFDNGLTMQFESSYVLNTDKPGRFIELYGEKAGVKMEPGVEYCTTQAGMYVQVKPTMDTNFDFDGAFAAQIKGFLAAVDGKAPCRATARDGVELMQIVDAVYESAKTGKLVEIKS